MKKDPPCEQSFMLAALLTIRKAVNAFFHRSQNKGLTLFLLKDSTGVEGRDLYVYFLV